MSTESNLVRYARNELELAGFFAEDSLYEGMLGEAVLKMVQLFAEEGHSGASAALAVQAFQQVAMFKPLSPLTGEDDEWADIGDDTFQNVRCSSVFKTPDRAYDIDGKVFRQPDGVCYRNRNSIVDITFPYMPETVYVDVDWEGRPVTNGKNV